LRRISRTASPLTLILCDVDHFKHHTDSFGHQFGDAVLRGLAKVLSSSVRRAGDFVGRFGGEEFALILPGSDRKESLEFAEQLRRGIASLPFGQRDGRFLTNITISIGVTTVSSLTQYTAQDVVRAADAALYRAKSAGRNCTRYCSTEGYNSWHFSAAELPQGVRFGFTGEEQYQGA
jgi:diguanylate cyclase (GGDEF)-like protein